jgi:ferredoxin--NADP+ reductase
MRLNELDRTAVFNATVHSNHRITPSDCPDDVRELVLDVEGLDPIPSPGQSIGILVPGDPAFGQKEHFRLYSVADIPEQLCDGLIRIKICVRRCDYVDSFSGERYHGRASHYLCDYRDGGSLRVTGPYGEVFAVPQERDATLILIGAGTGIAPFRAFIRHIFENEPDFRGHVQLFHGGRTGMDLLYQNDVRNDLSHYYDRETFESIEALSRRPHWNDKIDWGDALETRSAELVRSLLNPHTYVYVAGLEPIRDELDLALAKVFGSFDKWLLRKAELVAGRRWNELVY